MTEHYDEHYEETKKYKTHIFQYSKVDCGAEDSIVLKHLVRLHKHMSRTAGKERKTTVKAESANWCK